SGERIRVKGYRDKKATEAMAAELERRAARLAAGLADPMDEHTKKPLNEHLGDFIAYLRAKGNTAKHVALSETRIRAILDGCRFVRVADMQPSTVMGFLSELRAAGRGVKTVNEYLAAVKGFTRWLWKDRRIAVDPLSCLSKLSNGAADVR